MLHYFYEILEHYINFILIINLPDILKLIDVVDPNIVFKPLANGYSFNEENTKLSHQTVSILFNYKTLEISLLSNFSTEITIVKLFFFINLMLVKLFFLQVTPSSFWLVPASLLFVGALILLFLIKPNQTNKKLWLKAIYILIISIFYQLILIFIYSDFYQLGYLLKVGSSASLNLPFNLALAKLVLILIIFLTLLFTLIFYNSFYYKIINFIKPEFCSILLFLGFACHMLFLQNDLFSIFLYFEIISFCIYGLLFLHKRTNAQLHALIRYVLFSLWVSTCYIVGIMFHLLSQNFSTSLLYTSSNISFSFTYSSSTAASFENLIIQEFETVLSLIFILIYFLFKLGAGPFYTWTVEVYNACSTGSLLAVSLIPKLIYFPTLFFILFYNFFEYLSFWTAILASMGFITIFIGSFGIIITDKLKEIYAWSSVVHTGNMLLLISTVSSATMTFLIFYLVSYYLISFGYIIIITSLRN
jgi:NADH:ubiquinone oxidoreductase subunit 2 (subunit N)